MKRFVTKPVALLAALAMLMTMLFSVVVVPMMSSAAEAEKVGTLAPPDESKWEKSDANGSSLTFAVEDGVIKLGTTNGQWPSGVVKYDPVYKVKVATASIKYDFTAGNGEGTNINLFLNNTDNLTNGNPNGYIAFGTAIDPTWVKDTNKAGTFTGELKLSEVTWPEGAVDADGYVTLAAIKIFAVGTGAEVVTIRELDLYDVPEGAEPDPEPGPESDAVSLIPTSGNSSWAEDTMYTGSGVAVDLNESGFQVTVPAKKATKVTFTYNEPIAFDSTALSELGITLNSTGAYKFAFSFDVAKWDVASSSPSFDSLGAAVQRQYDETEQGHDDDGNKLTDLRPATDGDSSIAVNLPTTGAEEKANTLTIVLEGGETEAASFTFSKLQAQKPEPKAPATPDDPYHPWAATSEPDVATKVDILEKVGQSAPYTMTKWTRFDKGSFTEFTVDLNKTPYLYYSIDQPDGSWTMTCQGSPWQWSIDASTQKEPPSIIWAGTGYNAEGHLVGSQTGCIDVLSIANDPANASNQMTTTKINMVTFQWGGADAPKTINYLFFGSAPKGSEPEPEPKAPATPDDPYHPWAATSEPDVETKVDILEKVGQSAPYTMTQWTDFAKGSFSEFTVDLNKTPYLYYSIEQPDGSWTLTCQGTPWMWSIDASTQKEPPSIIWAGTGYNADGRLVGSQTGCIDVLSIANDPANASNQRTDTTINEVKFQWGGADAPKTINYLFFGSAPKVSEAPADTTLMPETKEGWIVRNGTGTVDDNADGGYVFSNSEDDYHFFDHKIDMTIPVEGKSLKYDMTVEGTTDVVFYLDDSHYGYLGDMLGDLKNKITGDVSGTIPMSDVLAGFLKRQTNIDDGVVSEGSTEIKLNQVSVYPAAGAKVTLRALEIVDTTPVEPEPEPDTEFLPTDPEKFVVREGEATVTKEGEGIKVTAGTNEGGWVFADHAMNKTSDIAGNSLYYDLSEVGVADIVFYFDVNHGTLSELDPKYSSGVYVYLSDLIEAVPATIAHNDLTGTTKGSVPLSAVLTQLMGRDSTHYLANDTQLTFKQVSLLVSNDNSITVNDLHVAASPEEPGPGPEPEVTPDVQKALDAYLVAAGLSELKPEIREELGLDETATEQDVTMDLAYGLYLKVAGEVPDGLYPNGSTQPEVPPTEP